MPNFNQVRKEMCELKLHRPINLRPQVNYDCQCADLHEAYACLTTVRTLLQCRIS